MEVRDVHALLGRNAYDADGDRIGTITGAYLDDATGRPSWMTVERGGLFRTTRSFVPMDGVELVDGGAQVTVTADAVRRAPHVDDDRVLTATDERELLHHYGLDQPPSGDAAGVAAGDAAGDGAPDPESGAMTRSEERVRVGTTTVPTARAVLRTTRVVEDRTFSVPLGRDQVQVAYEPLPGPDPAHGQTQPQTEPQTEPQTQPQTQPRTEPRTEGRTEPWTRPGPDADDDGWVVLYEERLVVRTEWVPVERVRLRTVGVQGEDVVQVDLRRELIDVDVEPAGGLGQENAGRS